MLRRTVAIFLALATVLPGVAFAAPNFQAKAMDAVISRIADPVGKEDFVQRLAAEASSGTLALSGATDPASKRKLRNYAGYSDAITSIQIPFSFSGADASALNAAIQAGKLHLSAVALTATPVLYRPDFSAVFGTETGTGLLLDEYSQIDPLEFVAFSGTAFRVKGVTTDKENVILKVETDDYPYPTDDGYYLDARFVQAFWTPVAKLENRKTAIPEKSLVFSRLRAMVGLPYVWGGDVPTGVPEMLSYYGPRGSADESLQSKWALRGVDCSGLLYSATDGATPRNTSALTKYGTGLDIAGKTGDEIKAELKPLDIIVWKGHTIIVLDTESTIESAGSFEDGTAGFPTGVRIRKISDVLASLLQKRVPLNSIDDPVPEGKKKFVVRRWYPESR
jgi:hypothetical protein